MLDRIRREPALVSGAVAALIALLTAFGLDLTAEQVGAVLAVVSALLAFVVRSQVTPVPPSEDMWPNEAGAGEAVWLLAVVGVVLLVLILVGKLNV